MVCSDRMVHPYLLFCPYLPLNKAIEFADWQIGPLEQFDNSWADPKFKGQVEAFLAKFVDSRGKRIEQPSILLRRAGQIDGQLPAPEEIEALEAALGFVFLDKNPRNTETTQHESWSVVTADNPELYIWPIDVDTGNVTVTTGVMVRTVSGGYTFRDPELVIRPPLELHMPVGACSADSECLEAVYKMVLQAAKSPGASVQADRLHVAIRWFIKAWRNTASVHFSERLVFLKTAFEALTGTSKSYQSARIVRNLFEGLKNTSPSDSELLLWSPNETPIHTRTKNGKQCSEQITDLEQWFGKFACARNTIIHQGIVPSLVYSGSNPAYDGHFVFTAEFLLRAAVKVSLVPFGYPNLWRSSIWRAVVAAYEELEHRQSPAGQAQGSTIEGHGT